MDRIITSLGLIGAGVAEGVDVACTKVGEGVKVACGAQLIKVKHRIRVINSSLKLLFHVIARNVLCDVAISFWYRAAVASKLLAFRFIVL
jgi:ribosomal protein L36